MKPFKAFLDMMWDRSARPAPAGKTTETLSAPRRPALRHALRALAADERTRRMPELAIAGLRDIVDEQRARQAMFLAAGVSPAASAAVWSDFVDGAVIGLCQLGCAVEGSDAATIAPFSVVAVGAYGTRRLLPDAAADLVAVLPQDEADAERAQRICGFVRAGLSILELQHRGVEGRAAQCAAVLQGQSETLHHVWGRGDLSVALVRAIASAGAAGEDEGQAGLRKVA